MIISHRHKFIFIHVPKTGGTSIRFALADMGLLDEDPMLQLTPQLAEQCGIPDRFAGLVKFHFPVCEQRKLVSEAAWNSYFKFAFVRNPWDRLVSMYTFLINDQEVAKKHPELQHQTQSCGNFADYIRKFGIEYPTYRQFLGRNGEAGVDFVGKQEQLQAGFDYVCETIGVSKYRLSQSNQSQHRHYSYYYQRESRKLVADRFACDIDDHGYRFDNQASVARRAASRVSTWFGRTTEMK